MDGIECDRIVLGLIEVLVTADIEEIMAETILELCRLVSTETELSALKSHESAISQLSV
ncbi:unnamed protein product, partial [Rotaria socialis]